MSKFLGIRPKCKSEPRGMVLANMHSHTAAESGKKDPASQTELWLGTEQRFGFSGDPPLPVARLTPATGHRENFFWYEKENLAGGR